MLFTFVNHLADATPPCLDHTRQIDTPRNRGIVWTRRMLAEELFHRPVIRERADVCNVYLVIGNAYLNRDVARIVLVNESIE